MADSKKVKKIQITTNINGQELDLLIPPYLSLLETL